MLTPIKAIRAKCVDCCAGDKFEPKRCTAFKCPLHPYRTGHRPKVANDTDNAITSEETQKAPLSGENTTLYTTETKMLL